MYYIIYRIVVAPVLSCIAVHPVVVIVRLSLHTHRTTYIHTRENYWEKTLITKYIHISCTCGNKSVEPITKSSHRLDACEEMNLILNIKY